jgi:hypothetical protein
VVARVKGDAVLKADHGRAEARQIDGTLELGASFDQAVLEDVGGRAVVKVQHGGVSAERLRGGVRVETEGDAVILRDVAGAVEVVARRGRVELQPLEPLADLQVETTHGEIRLDVPAGSPFEVEASSRHGEVRAEVAGLAWEKDGRAFRGRVGDGGARVTLRAAHGDVTITSRAARASR